MFFAFLYAKKFSRDGHFKYLFLNLDQSIIAFLSSLVINLAWFPPSFFIFKRACLSNNTFRKIDVNMSYYCSSLYELLFINS